MPISPPKCKICRTAHWSNAPHDRAGMQAVKKDRTPPKPDAKPKHSQGRGAR